jgi:hypothetical protein
LIHSTAPNQELHIEEGARLLGPDDVKACGATLPRTATDRRWS